VSHFTKEQIAEIQSRILTKTVRDSEFDTASALQDVDLIPILQDGNNKKVFVQTLINRILSEPAIAEAVAAVQMILDLKPGHLDRLGIYVGTTEYWASKAGFIPLAGTIVIYTDYATLGNGKKVPGFKIGTGNAFVQDLAFSSDKVVEMLDAHITDTEVHITNAERIKWNNKLNVNDSSEVVNGTLILNRN